MTEVFEAGLGVHADGPAGTHVGQAGFPTTASGAITFSSGDGVGSVTLAGHALGTNALTPTVFADLASDGFTTIGQVSAFYTLNGTQGTISYTYVLLDNVANANGNPVDRAFTVLVRDPDTGTASGTLHIGITDDGPLAHADSDSLDAGTQTASGNVLTGVSTDGGTAGSGVDLAGADGQGAVIGVEAGAQAAGHTGGLNTAVTGAHGTLVLNAQGSYTYTHDPLRGAGADTFTYTLKDADGSTSVASLVITVPADATPGSIVLVAGSIQ